MIRYSAWKDGCCAFPCACQTCGCEHMKNYRRGSLRSGGFRRAQVQDWNPLKVLQY